MFRNTISVFDLAPLITSCTSSYPVGAAGADRAFFNSAVYTVDEDHSCAEAVEVTEGGIIMTLENEPGSIELGKRADLAVLDRNLIELKPSEFNEAKVVMTIFNGRTDYE